MDLVSIPANPVPEGVVTGMLKTRDGVSMRFARWHPPPGRKGTVCLFQGRAEFIEKYFETVRELRARGFAVATIDWRGQGGSERALADPRKGHVGDFSEYERDVEALMNEVVLPDCPPPIFAIGHSMGGTVMMRVARQGSRWFDRIVLSAPMIRLVGKRNVGAGQDHDPRDAADRHGLGLRAGRQRRPWSRPALTSTTSRPPIRCATPAPRRCWRRRPNSASARRRCHGSTPPIARWARSPSPRYASKVRQPLMLIAAGRDRWCRPPRSRMSPMRLRAGSHLIIAGARHELMMEQDRYRAQFWAAFDAFVPGTPLFK